MSNDPILVLQMQRMGDLILSFPLLGYLQHKFPDNPIWTVAEPRFFSELFRFAPSTVFFPPEARERLLNRQYHSVINLSHREEAAHIAGSVTAGERFGAYTCKDDHHIAGYWALYRASIVHNNRHNLFHWSDLHLLDHTEGTDLPPLRSHISKASPSRRVGIFVGASEVEKRPSPQFFAALAVALLRKGFKPLFLGGPLDIALGEEAARLSNIPNASLCGKLSLVQLAEVMGGLALLVTPDTGPMHLAAWIDTPVLNLSMGPVNAWETGPIMSGHHVLRPSTSCVGCWHCNKQSPLCKNAFVPARVALVVHTLLNNPERSHQLHLPGLELWRSGRDTAGLYELLMVSGRHDAHLHVRHVLSRLWQHWFLQRSKQASLDSAWIEQLATSNDRALHALHRAVLSLGKNIRAHFKALLHGGPSVLPANFWKEQPPILRPFSGHMHLYLQNKCFSRQAWQHVLEDLEVLVDYIGARN